MLHFLRKNPKAGKEAATKKAKQVSALSNLIANKITQMVGNDEHENQEEAPAEEGQPEQEENNQEENVDGGEQNENVEKQEGDEEGYEQEFDQEEDQKDVEQEQRKKPQQKAASANATAQQGSKLGGLGLLLGSTGKDQAKTETNFGASVNQENLAGSQQKQENSLEQKFGFKVTKKMQQEMEFKRKEKEEWEKKIQDKKNAIEAKKQKEKEVTILVNY